MALHILEVEVNAEGNKLGYLSPEGKSGYRIAGPKAWGGSRNVAKLKIYSDDIASYINQYAPDVAELLNKQNAIKYCNIY